MRKLLKPQQRNITISINKPWFCKFDMWFNYIRGLKITSTFNFGHVPNERTLDHVRGEKAVTRKFYTHQYDCIQRIIRCNFERIIHRIRSPRVTNITALTCSKLQSIIFWMQLDLRCWDIRTRTSGILSLSLSVLVLTVPILVPTWNVCTDESSYLSLGQREESQPRLRNIAFLNISQPFS